MIEIRVPIRLVSEANNTDHWRVKHKRKKKIKELLDLYWPKDFDVVLPCTIELIRVAPRRLDFDNLVNSMKGVRDYCADKLSPGLQAGRADDDERMTWRYSQERGNPREYGLIIRFHSSSL